MLSDLFKKVRYITIPGWERQKDNKQNLITCEICGKIFAENEFLPYKVCPRCGYHSRIGVYPRIELICDKESFEEYDKNLRSENPLGFEGYSEKIEKASAETGLNEAVITGKCKISGEACLIAVMSADFMMASMGSVVGEKLARLFARGINENLPVVIFTASGGARMQEGIISLMQMAKVSAAAKKHSLAGGLYITVLTDPTTGGVTASFAMLGDIILAEPGATVGFAGRRVIEATIGQKLPEDFQSAEFQLEHGFADMIVRRQDLKVTLGKLLKLHGKGGGI